jgi:hypothetical protein
MEPFHPRAVESSNANGGQLGECAREDAGARECFQQSAVVMRAGVLVGSRNAFSFAVIEFEEPSEALAGSDLTS